MIQNIDTPHEIPSSLLVWSTETRFKPEIFKKGQKTSPDRVGEITDTAMQTGLTNIDNHLT